MAKVYNMVPFITLVRVLDPPISLIMDLQCICLGLQKHNWNFVLVHTKMKVIMSSFCQF